MSAKLCASCGRTTGGHLLNCMFCGAPLEGPVERTPVFKDFSDEQSDRLYSLGEALLESVGTKKQLSQPHEPVSDVQVASEDSPHFEDFMEGHEALLPLLDSDVLSIIPASSTEEPVLRSVLLTASSHKEKRLRLLKHIWAFQDSLKTLESQVNIGWSKGVHQAAVVIEGPKNPETAEQIQKIFDIDLYQAKLMARKSGFFVAKRASVPEELQKPALRYRQVVERPATVVTRSNLLQQPDPWLVINAPDPHYFDVQSKALWLGFDGVPAVKVERSISAEPSLAVMGEVDVQRYVRKKRKTSSKNGDWEKVGQGRIGVIDLHAPHCVLRFVEGLSHLSNLPGYVPSASKKSHRAFAENLQIWNPNLRCLASKVMSVTNPIFPMELTDRFVSHSWSDWERYSRMARALYGL